MKFFLIAFTLGCTFFVIGQEPAFIHKFEKHTIRNYFKPMSKKALKWIDKIEPEFELDYFNSFKYDSLFVKMKHSVNAYSVIHPFKAKHLDTTIQCSGVLFMPDTDHVKGEVIYIHGTIIPQNGKSIPSYLKNYKDDTTKFYSNVNYAMLMSSLGYIVYVPDLIGYGASRSYPHPFAHYKTNGEAVKSFYDSCKPFVESKFNNTKEIYFTGISEGAGIALGTLRIMESDGNYNIKGASLCAGPYNMFASLKWYFEKEKMPAFPTMAYKWSGYTIWQYEQLNLSDIFIHPPKKTKSIYSLYDLFFGKRKINKIYTPAAISLVQKNDIIINSILNRNSPMFFTPRSKIALYHGEKDQIVPFVNSKSANEYYKVKNCDVVLNSYSNLGHVSIVQPYIFETILELAK